jgi:hypothetical protein
VISTNTSCVLECGKYKDFLRSKPVFHIEYTKSKTLVAADPLQDTQPKSKSKGLGAKRNSKSPSTLGQYCSFRNTPDWGPKFSTVIKLEALDGWVQFCDGSFSITRLVEDMVRNGFGRPKAKTGKRMEDEVSQGVNQIDGTVPSEVPSIVPSRRV